MSALDVGIGLRPPHYQAFLDKRPQLAFVEVVTENFLGLREGKGGGRPVEILERVRASHPVALHGVSLNLGSVDPLSDSYLDKLAGLVERIQPQIVSDHLSWTGVRGENLHDLLPLPYTEEAVAHVANRIERAQERLGRRVLIENVSSYLQFTQSEMSEWEFITAIARRSGCGILLDVNNVYVSAANHGFDPIEYVQSIPRGLVGQIHLAGHTDAGTHLLDTHDAPVCDAVWGLFALALLRFGAVPTLIEWDDKLPALERLLAEARSAAKIQEVVLGQALRDAKVDALDHHRSARRAERAA
jgi:uncharacterized protein (UPF0276 family)